MRSTNTCQTYLYMFRYGFSCQRKTPRVLVFNHLPIFLNRFHQHETTKNSIADTDLCFLQLVNTHLFIDLTDSRKSVAFIYKTSNFNIFLLLGNWSCEQRKRHDNLHCKLIFPMHAWSATCGETILISCMKNYIYNLQFFLERKVNTPENACIFDTSIWP